MKRALAWIAVCGALAGGALAEVPSTLSNRAPEGWVPIPGIVGGGGGGCPCVSGTPEGEANCGLPVDTVNGGCNFVPEVTSPIDVNSPVCGTAEWDVTVPTFRDTDWYEFTVETAGDFTWRVEAEFPAQLAVIDALCPASILFGSDTTTGCGDVGEVTLNLAPGTYRFFIAPSFGTPPITCGTEYTATLVGDAQGVLAIPAASRYGLAIIALALAGLALFWLRRRTA